MPIRSIIIYAFFLSYIGSLAHSILPHHHHKSSEELTEHHHETGNHEPTNEDKGEQNEASHFLNHSSNVDVLISKLAVKTIKQNSVKFAEIRHSENLNQLVLFYKEVFHPPSDDEITYQVKTLFHGLRAPPYPLALAFSKC